MIEASSTNACELVYFLYQIFLQMIGSKIVTGVVDFITPLQRKKNEYT